mgnify:CR=1 FL=1
MRLSLRNDSGAFCIKPRGFHAEGAKEARSSQKEFALFAGSWRTSREINLEDQYSVPVCHEGTKGAES